MDNRMSNNQEVITKRRKTKKIWKSIVSVLACIVVFCTTYALILPAITLEAETYCGNKEHSHGEECYSTELICTLTEESETVKHKHKADCYIEEKALICSQEESEGHTHGEACQKLEEELVCGQEESEEHAHTDECYEEKLTYVCGQEESEGHLHTDECYEVNEKLVCELETEEITKEHVHTESCYEKKFTCELVEHTHTKICYSNKEADVETATDWENTLPKELTGVWADDVLAVADSQLGYTESTRNYVVDDDGETRGYTRYGDWYGDSYGHWCAMFASFCLEYAKVDEALMPHDASCQNWIETLSKEKYQLYHEVGTYDPVPGDLIFFNWDDLGDSDHVGFVYEVIEATDEHGVQVKTIEGNASDTVKYRTYDIDDESIMGYGQLPENPEVEEEEKVVEEEEKGVLAKVFSLAKSAESTETTESTTTTDSYAPGITLTGEWNADMLAIAESQVGKNNDTGKYSEWYTSKFSTTTTDWTAQFITYCLSYAGVPQAAIPYYTSGDMSTYITQLEQSDFYFEKGNGTPQAGDLVIGYPSWNNDPRTVGIVKSLQQNGNAVNAIVAFSNGTVKETGELWGKADGFVRMPKGEKTTTVNGILTATATYKYGTIPSDVELVVELHEENTAWDNALIQNLSTIDKSVMSTYFIEAYFVNGVERYEPSVPVDIEINFTSELDSMYNSTYGNEAPTWVYRKINGNDVAEASVTGTITDKYKISNLKFQYVSTDAIALAALQKYSATKEITTDYGKATAKYDSTALPYGVDLVVSISESSETWDSQVKANLSGLKKSILKTYYIEVYGEKESGECVDLNGPIDISIDFNPDLDSGKDANSQSGAVEWHYGIISADDTLSSWTENTSSLTWDNKLNSLSFTHTGAKAYSMATVQDVHVTDTLTVENVGNVTVDYNKLAVPEGAQLHVELSETATGNWDSLVKAELLSAEKSIRKTYYLQAYFMKDGVKVDVSNEYGNIDIAIDFDPNLVTGKDTHSKSGSVSWEYRKITNDNTITTWTSKTSDTISSEALDKIAFTYEADTQAIALSTVQKVYSTYTLETDFGVVTADYNILSVPKGAELVVELSSDSHEVWSPLIDSEFAALEQSIRKNYYLKTYFVKDGKEIEISVNESNPINIKIEFNPILSPNMDKTEGSSGITWYYRKIQEDGTIAEWKDVTTETQTWTGESCIYNVSYVYDGSAAHTFTALQEVHKIVDAETDAGIITANYNEAAFPLGTKFIANLVTDETKTTVWNPELEAKYESAENPGYQITNMHYLEAYFEYNGERVEPKSGYEIQINAQFTPALDSNASTYEKSEALSWFVNNISTDENQNIVIGDLTNEKTVTVNEEDDIASFDFKYEKADAFSFTAMQEAYTFLNAEQMLGNSKVTISAVGKTAVLPEGSQIVVEFVENDEIKQTLKSTHETERYKLANIQIFTIKFLDAQGIEFTPEENTVDIMFTVDPALSAAFEDGTLTIGEWVMNYIVNNEGTLSVGDPTEADAVQLSMTDDFELTDVSFSYSKKDYYALSAKMDDPAYKTEVTVSDYQGLADAVTNAGSEKTIIKLDSSFAAGGTIEIPTGKNIVVDLAGQTITTSDSSLFNITGGRLTIQDSKATHESVETETGTNVYGNVASYKDKTLTYYVTVPTVTNATMGETKEHLEKHTVAIKGEITGGSVPAIVIESGTVNLESGAITNYTNRAIVQKSGILNLKGGYICGNTATTIEVVDGLSSWDNQTAGGAVYVTGDSKLNISGSVLAANSVPERGGAIGVESNANAVVKMTGGVLSGNMSTSLEATSNQSHGWHYGGGGIALYGNASMTMSGGYVTNNKVCSEGYFEGGGGIFLADSTQLIMLDGKVTGNYAGGGGGGIRSDFMGAAYTNTIISGGFVSSNYAHTAEGGGVSVGWDGTAHVTGGYITNNITATVQHWGGGGLFVSNGGSLYIKNALLTANHAGGFGGGVAGCSTGRVFLISEYGSAIWGNSADGTTVTDGSEKAEDKIYGLNNPVFLANGYQDYFCALTSTVEGMMIGGGASNWKGSADEVPISIGKDQSYTASYVMGLTSYPSTTDKNNALEIINSSNGVYINGNNSNTHGGGVLCNGYLVFGKPGEITFSTGLEVNGRKDLLNGEETSIPLVDAEGNPEKFKFYIVDANTNTVISTGENDENGAIAFSARIPFADAGTYTYYVYEDQDYNSDGFVMDTSKYRLTVKVESEKTYLNNAGEDTIIKVQYIIKHIKVEKNNGGDNWSVVKDYDVGWEGKYEYEPVRLALTDAATFKNYDLEKTKIVVQKKWDGEIPENTSITVGLYRWDIVDGVKTTEEPVLQGEKVILSAENNWKHEWNEELPLLSTDKNTSYEYEVIEDAVEGYSPSYTVSNETVLDETTGKYINIATYTITNKRTEELRYSVDITKISDEKTPDGQDIPLGNAEFEFSLKSSTGEEALYFLKESDGAYVYCDANTQGATTTLITNLRGKLVLKGLPAGTYVLEETKAPNGYLIAESKEFILGEESGKTTLSYTIVDERDQSGFELPETGGPGTNVYTAGGILLLMISVLLYIKRKNQMKGGLVSN